MEKVTCFVTNADTLTMLCREGDVEANDSFRRQLTPSCNFQKCRLKILMLFCLVQDYNMCISERTLSTLVANVVRVALSNVVWLVGVVFGPILDIWNSFVSLSTATIGPLGRRAESVVGCEQVSFVLVL